MDYEFDSEDIPYSMISESTDSETKQLYWDIAIGLQDVDSLKPSSYLLDLSKDNIEGRKNIKKVKELINEYYKDKDLDNSAIRNEKEADYVSTKIVGLIEDSSFSFRPIALKEIHEDLFKNIYDHSGKYRNCNITKSEFILNKDSVEYISYDKIEDNLEYDFKKEKEFDYSNLTIEERIQRICEFTSSIWQIHPFFEGNTRTIAVFIIKYFNNIGYNVNNDLFKDNSRYFRNALVRSNYSNRDKNVYPTNEFLIKFYENLFLGKKHELDSRDLIVKELFDSE